jgi:hypothetical protein
MGNELSATASRVELARLDLKERSIGSAERLAREAAGWYRARRFPGGEADATAILADSLFRLGRHAEAYAAAERARTLLPEGDLELRLSIESSLAGVDDPARRAAVGSVKVLRRRSCPRPRAGVRAGG